MRFDEILENLDETLEFCKSLGLSTVVENSRFTRYREHIARLQKILAFRSGGSLPDDLAAELQKNNLKFVMSLTESLELISTLPYLKTIDSKVARYKLRKVLIGPFVSIEENQNSNESRNTLFELNLASKLAVVGLNPKLGEADGEPDIEIMIEGKLVLIECKRPLNLKSVKKNIKAAKKGLNSQLKKMPTGSRGIIAISMSKAMNPRDDFLLYSDESSAKKMLGNLLEQQAGKAKTNLGNKIIGVLFYVIIRSYDREKEIYALGQQINFEESGHTDLDRETFKIFYETLQQLTLG